MNNWHQDQPPFVLHAGTEPLLVSMPHVGTYLPPAIAARLTVEAHRVPDTDWHLDRLYAFAKEMGASILMATHSRYVVDLNRPSDNTSLYPGQCVTTLCPLDTFDDALLYLEGMAPDAAEIAARVSANWHPYHQQLRAELARNHVRRCRRRTAEVVLEPELRSPIASAVARQVKHIDRRLTRDRGRSAGR